MIRQERKVQQLRVEVVEFGNNGTSIDQVVERLQQLDGDGCMSLRGAEDAEKNVDRGMWTRGDAVLHSKLSFMLTMMLREKVSWRKSTR